MTSGSCRRQAYRCRRTPFCRKISAGSASCLVKYLHKKASHRPHSRSAEKVKVKSPCVLISKIPASSFVSLHLSPCMLIPKIPASSFVSLHLSPCMLTSKIPASSFVSLHLSPCMLITEIAAAPSLPSFVSLRADYRNRCRS